MLAIFLHEELHLSTQQTGTLMGMFGFAVWFLPSWAGAWPRFGFRRSLAFAYLILTAGYFLMGSLTAGWMAPLRERLPLYWLVFAVLMVPALGPSVVKPCVAGTIARASTNSVRSIGYSIYYTMVNIGGMLGPSPLTWCGGRSASKMFFGVGAIRLSDVFGDVLFYREPTRSGEQAMPSVGAALRNMFVVLGNVRLMVFLLIFSGFWVVYWQEFVAPPLFHTRLRESECQRSTFSYDRSPRGDLLPDSGDLLDAKVPRPRHDAGPSDLQLLLADSVRSINYSFRPGRNPVLAPGEMTQSARYYDYISRLAPPGQQGTLYGIRFSAHRHRIFHWRAGGRVSSALLRRRAAPPAADVVGNLRDRICDHAADVDHVASSSRRPRRALPPDEIGTQAPPARRQPDVLERSQECDRCAK